LQCNKSSSVTHVQIINACRCCVGKQETQFELCLESYNQTIGYNIPRWIPDKEVTSINGVCRRNFENNKTLRTNYWAIVK
jgi:hypothetical protein